MSLLTFAVEAVPEVSFTSEANWFLENVWIIPLLPALSFLGILFFGKRMPKGGAELGIAAIGAAFILAILTNVAWLDHRDNFDGVAESKLHGVVEDSHGDDHGDDHGDEEDHASATLNVDGVAEDVTLTALAEEGGEESHPAVAVLKQREWLVNGGVSFLIGTMLDGPSAVMLFVVTMISLLVHIYLSLIHI